MGRNAKYDRAGISAAALELVASGGPQAATVAAIADRLGAPTGSIYHRFRSREVLLAELWMGVVEGFQNGFVAELMAEGEVMDAALRAAHYIPRWVRGNMSESRLLLLHRREDFVGGGWPEELVERAAALEPQMSECLRAYCRRAFASTSKANLRRARYALLDAPYGAVKPYVEAGKPPPRLVDELLGETVRAVLS
jgi:AcrR family transcriptional regulator